MKRCQLWTLGLLVSLAPLLAPGAASAQAKTDEAKAQELAAEAWRLSEAHRTAEACALYRKALALKSSPGLLNNVGRCFVQEGDPVRAIETYESSVELAKQQEPGPKRQAWLQFARQEIDVLEPQLSKLVFRLPRIAGLALSLDGQSLPIERESVWVKPGLHHLEVSAPSKLTHSAELIPTAGERMQVEVPALAPVAARSTAATPQRPPAEPAGPAAERARHEEPAGDDGPSHVLPWTLVGTGTAMIAAGVVTGLMASSKEKELSSNCPKASCPSPDQEPGWQDKIDSTKTMATVTDVLWGVGLVTLGVGVTLFVLDDGGADERAELAATCRGDGCGLRLRGSF